MAFSPRTGLIYIPAQDIPFVYGTDASFRFVPGLWNIGVKQLFADRCMVCHGDGAVGGGVIPDLRYLGATRHAAWLGAVLGGLHAERGMVSFAGVLSPDDALAIQSFVIERAHQLKERRQAP